MPNFYKSKASNSLALVLIVAIGSVSPGCKKAESTGPKIRTAKVDRGDITQTVVATGRIHPLRQIEIRSKSGGTVRKLYVEAGDWVNKGEKLFEITPESSPAEQVSAREGLRTAEVELRQTEDKLRIAKELYDKRLAPEQTFLDAEREVDLAHARLSAAEAQWALIQREQIGETEDNTAGSLDIVQSSTTVKAPISGIVFTRQVDEGASVTPTTSASGGTIVMTMGDDDNLEFRGNVDEADVGKLKLGIEVNITVQAYPGEVFKGAVSHISPVGTVDDDQEKQTVFGVRAQVDNPEKKLKVGLTATAKIVVDQRKEVLIVDDLALNFTGDSIFVKVVTDTVKSTTEQRVVKLGITDGIRTEITDGLSGGEVLSLGAVVSEED